MYRQGLYSMSTVMVISHAAVFMHPCQFLAIYGFIALRQLYQYGLQAHLFSPSPSTLGVFIVCFHLCFNQPRQQLTRKGDVLIIGRNTCENILTNDTVSYLIDASIYVVFCFQSIIGAAFLSEALPQDGFNCQRAFSFLCFVSYYDSFRLSRTFLIFVLFSRIKSFLSML